LPFPNPTTARTYSLLVFFLLLRAFGNLSLAWGTKHFSQTLSVNPVTYILAMLDPFVALGVGMLIVALLVRMALLSLADLSFVLPLTAIGYVLAALCGEFFLHEGITAGQWLGILMIFAGAALVGSTPQSTAKEPGQSK
jgi:drug/metabolite transporter (DMT)-like permease